MGFAHSPLYLPGADVSYGVRQNPPQKVSFNGKHHFKRLNHLNNKCGSSLTSTQGGVGRCHPALPGPVLRMPWVLTHNAASSPGPARQDPGSNQSASAAASALLSRWEGPERAQLSSRPSFLSAQRRGGHSCPLPPGYGRMTGPAPRPGAPASPDGQRVQPLCRNLQRLLEMQPTEQRKVSPTPAWHLPTHSSSSRNT